MDGRQTVIIVMLFGLLGGISAWLQFGLLSSRVSTENGAPAAENNDPDYYIENLVSTGIDRRGKQYRLSADRLTHYPVDERALLERPHLIQYLPSGPPRHIHADSGWLYRDGAEVLLTGNVRVVENGDAGAAVSSTNKMLIRLKNDRSER